MERQIQTLSERFDQNECASHRLFNEYIDDIRAGRKGELLDVEQRCQDRLLFEKDEKKKANLYRDQVVIDLALAEQTMQDHGNPYFALCENEHARDKLKSAELLEPQNKENKVLNRILRTAFYESTSLPEFYIIYPGGFPIDTCKSQSYHRETPAARVHE
ncbi:MAG: hypothetical protein P4L53_19755 [Candidatus Obscuribacterales bacterium]|nr:hypothetical protein [Candidatus Obscuribacterales bacterium]